MEPNVNPNMNPNPNFNPNMMPPQQPKKRAGFSIASLIIGICALLFNCCCFPWLSPILGALAVVFGILGMREGIKGLSIAGIILGAIGFVASLVLIILTFVAAGQGSALGFNALGEILGSGNIGGGAEDVFEDLFHSLDLY